MRLIGRCRMKSTDLASWGWLKRAGAGPRWVHPLIWATLLGAGLGGCGAGNRLAQYDFPRLTLAVVPEFPPYPEVLSGPYFPGHPKDPVHAIIRAGTRIAKEIEADRVRDRLDSAAAMVDVARLTGDRLAARASRYLGSTLTDPSGDTDLILEVEIRDYGIDAEEWDAAARFFIDAEAWLLDGQDRRVIWKTRVRAHEPITPAIFHNSSIRNVVTAAALADLSVEDIGRALTQLSYYAADRVTDRLRSSLDRARPARP